MTRKGRLNFLDSREVVLQYYEDITTNSVHAVLPLLGITASKNPARSFPHCLVKWTHFPLLLLKTSLCMANVGSLCWVSVGMDKHSPSNISLLGSGNNLSQYLLSHRDIEWRWVVELYM